MHIYEQKTTKLFDHIRLGHGRTEYGRFSHSKNHRLKIGIFEAREASFHKFPEDQGFSEGLWQYDLSCKITNSNLDHFAEKFIT